MGTTRRTTEKDEEEVDHTHTLPPHKVLPGFRQARLRGEKWAAYSLLRTTTTLAREVALRWPALRTEQGEECRNAALERSSRLCGRLSAPQTGSYYAVWQDCCRRRQGGRAIVPQEAAAVGEPHGRAQAEHALARRCQVRAALLV